MEDKYKSLTGPELAGEDAFIHWVIKGENHQSWTHWQQKNPEQAGTITEARHIIKSVAALPVEQMNAEEKNEIWRNINASIHRSSEYPARKTSSIIRWSLAAAATFALVFWIMTQQVQNVIAHAGEKKDITLPESSQIMVNAGSKITYHKKKFTSDRELRLDGEAFFEVNPGSQFTVLTDRGSVVVMGTSFNVISRPGRFEVSCHTGNVIVKKGGEEIEIKAGERVYEEQNILKQSKFATTDKAPWMQGKFIFDNQPLSIVVDELERQYDIRVILPKEIRDMRYTGLFETGDLKNALYMITWPLHLQYEIKGNSVAISR